MLSAFTARPIIELKQRDKSKIETILAHGDRVLVGLNTGSLRVYRLNDLPPPQAVQPPPSPAKPSNGTPRKSTESSRQSLDTPSKPPALRPTDLLRELEKFSPRSIDQLGIIKVANTLVVLTNYAVHLHDLTTYEPLGSGFAPLPRTKNATCFAVTSNIRIVQDGHDGDEGAEEESDDEGDALKPQGIPEIISRLAVAVKRRLLLWKWRESELVQGEGRAEASKGKKGTTEDDDGIEEIVLAESIRTVTWANATRLICGMNSGYVMVNVETHAVEDIVAPGTLLPSSSNVSNGTSSTASGGSRFGAIGSAGMGYMGLGGYIPKPLSAKLAEGQVLLAKDINTMFVTDEGRPMNKRQIPWAAAPDAIGYSYPYILALQPPAKGLLEVRSPETLSLVQNISLPGAAQLHFPPPTYSLAHAGKGFHISSERAVWKMDATDYDDQVSELMKEHKYDEAVSLLGMLEDALLKDKNETLREVKMRKAEMLFAQKRYRDSIDLFNEDEVHASPERVLKLYPRAIGGDVSEEPGEDASDHSDDKEQKDVKTADQDELRVGSPLTSPGKAGTGFASMLLGHRKVNSETGSILSASKGGAGADDAASIAGKVDDNGPLQGKDLMTAVMELRGFLAGTRQRLQRLIDPATGNIKPDTSTDAAARDAHRALLRAYGGGDLDDSDEEREEKLKDTFKLVDTCLFRAYMYSAPTLASSLFRIPNLCDPDVVKEKLLESHRYNELVDFFYGKKLHREALQLLKQFGEKEDANPDAPSLHGPDRTIAYLQSLPAEMIDLILEFSDWTLRASPDAAMEIFVGDTDKAESLPRDKVIAFLDGIDKSLETQYLEHIIEELGDSTPDYHNKLLELLVAEIKSRTRDEAWEARMQRLVEFLSSSGAKYSLGKAFGLVPKDDPGFYEAQAIVLSNMGQDKQALMVYVFKMEDYAKAEEYCNRIHLARETASTTSPTQDSTAEDTQSIYHTLLSLYLHPPPPHKPSLTPALSLLSKHGARLPAASSLSLIPDTLPISSLESYFRGRIRSANSTVNISRILKGLSNVELVNSQAALMLGEGLDAGPRGQSAGRNRRVLVEEDGVCGVCHKRFGGRTVVAALPGGEVVHYGCLARMSGSPVQERVAPAWGRKVSRGQ